MVMGRVVPYSGYSVKQGAEEALGALLSAIGQDIPADFLQNNRRILFTNPIGDEVLFPCPLKEQEALAAIRALEGLAVCAIVDLQSNESPRARTIEVDLARNACFLMSAYVCTVAGMDKAHPGTKFKIPDTDLNQAQSLQYRRLSANLYATKNPGEYYHIHGSLEASKTLRMLGLPPFDPNLCRYEECIATIESAVKCFSISELEELNLRYGQAGIPVLKPEQFRATTHGRAISALPPFTIECLETLTPPLPFQQLSNSSDAVSGGTGNPHSLSGVRVLELCRVIAGPTIGRSLAAHGASVLKVTSEHLPDVPFFQVDVNTGKHTTSLHLHNAADRRVFEVLLASADVILDGYRPGALERLGYGPNRLSQLARARGKGFVYVAEDCFGGSRSAKASQAVWAARPGWQQIADCATGVAWEQGRFMGLEEPVVPPFPMSDYGTGALGCLAALVGLYRRATKGGSWSCRTSLCQYDLFLLSLGTHSPEVQTRLRKLHDPAFFALRHHDSVDEVGKRALTSMRRVHPVLFNEAMMETAWSPGFQGFVRWPKETLRIDGIKVGHVRATRPNGFDAASWDDWEVQDDMLMMHGA